MASESTAPSFLFFALLSPCAKACALTDQNGGEERATIFTRPRAAFIKVGAHPCVVHAGGAAHANAPLGLQLLPHSEGGGVFWPQPKRFAFAMHRAIGHEAEDGERLVDGLRGIVGFCVGCFKLIEGQQPCGCG